MRLVSRCAVVLASAVLIFPSSAKGQAIRVGHTRAVAGAGTLSIIVAPSQVNFTLAARGTAFGSSPLNITTNYSGLAVPSMISLCGYFSSATASLVGTKSSAVIPSTAVSGQVTTGLPTSYTAFTQATPFGGAGAGLKIFSMPAMNGTGGRTDALSLKIDLSTHPQLPADTYTGTLIIQVQAL